MNLSDYRTSVEVYIAELQAKLRASEDECERLRREVEDVRKLDEWLREDRWHQVVLDLGVVRGESISLLFHDERYTAVHRVEESFSAARRAAVEYLEKERKLPPQPQPSERVEDAGERET